MNYKQFNEWAQEQINALPIYYAFGTEQFNEMLQKHFNGMTLEQAKTELYRTDAGGYYYRSDADKINATYENITDTFERLKTEDITGDGFIYEMFLYELLNHEYGYTNDITETLDAVGITETEIQNKPAYRNGLNKAIQKIKGGSDQ